MFRNNKQNIIYVNKLHLSRHSSCFVSKFHLSTENTNTLDICLVISMQSFPFQKWPFYFFRNLDWDTCLVQQLRIHFVYPILSESVIPTFRCSCLLMCILGSGKGPSDGSIIYVLTYVDWMDSILSSLILLQNLKASGEWTRRPEISVIPSNK